MNIEEYIENYNYTFNEKGFNLVDNLILSQIPYLKFGEIIGKNDYITIKESYKLFIKKNSSDKIKKLSYLERKVLNMISLLSTSKRFCDAILSNYVSIINEVEQFGAIVIKLNDNTKYVSFEGSDGSLIGWKENFALMYTYPTITHQTAINYLNHVITPFDKDVRIGGHSKGGNLAMVAYMESHLWVKNKITNIYNNDGPGFREQEYNSSKYQKMLEKLTMITPENSIIGMLMFNTKHPLVIEASSFGIYSHSVFNWKCNNNNLVLSNLKKSSIKLNQVIVEWLKKLNDTQKQKMVETLFELLGEDKMTSRFNFENVIDVIKGIKTIDKETKKAMLEIISVLKQCLKENVINSK